MQPNLFHRYPLTHTTYVCFPRTGFEISCIRASLSSTVRRDNLKSNFHAESVDTIDFLAFSLLIFSARTLKIPGLGFSSLWEIIGKDAPLYLLVIFASHLVLEMTLILGRVSGIVSLFLSR